MSDQAFMIQFAPIEQCMAEMVARTKDIQGILDGLDSNLKTNFDEAHWTPETQSLYQNSQNNWNMSLTNMNTLLSNAQRSLGHIAENYGVTEQQAQKVWSDMGVSGKF